jgi:uncharacterized membrane protein YbhN (UPF0104 family)
MSRAAESIEDTRPRLVGWVPGLVVLAGLIWLVATHLSEEERFAALLARSRPWWLGVAAVLQGATYLTVGETWRFPLKAAGHPFSRRRLALFALLKLTVDQAVPTGGVSGTIFVIRRLGHLGVPADALGATMLIVLVGYYLAYALAVGAALAVLWFHRDLSRIVAGVATVFAILAASLPLALVWFVRRKEWRPPAWLHRVPWFRSLLAETAAVSPDLVKQTRLFLGSATGSFVTMLLDSATLAATLLAVGARPDPLSCFAALVMASVAATVGIIPGGLGTFEAASVGVLKLTGTSLTSAVAATLLLRGFTFWLPMIPGLVLLRLVHGPRAGVRLDGADG